MKDRALLGLGRHMIPLPRMLWQRRIKSQARKIRASLGFMSQDHRRVHHFVVAELPRAGEPLGPETIAQKLDLAAANVISILGELERRLTFLFRNGNGAVSWAYPVTVDKTPHRARFSSGEDAFSP